MSTTEESFTDFTSIQLAQAQTSTSIWRSADGYQVALIMTGVILLCFVLPLFYFLFILTKGPPSSKSPPPATAKEAQSNKTRSDPGEATAKTHRSGGSKRSSKLASRTSKPRSAQSHKSHKLALKPQEVTRETVVIPIPQGKRESLKHEATTMHPTASHVASSPLPSVAKQRGSIIQDAQRRLTVNTIPDAHDLLLKSRRSLLTTSSEAKDMMSKRSEMLSLSGVTTDIPNFRTSVHKMDLNHYANDSESSWIVRGFNQCEGWRKQNEETVSSENQNLVKLDSLMSMERVAGIIASKDLKSLHLARPPSFDGAISAKPTLDGLNKLKQIDEDLAAMAKRQPIKEQELTKAERKK